MSFSVIYVNDLQAHSRQHHDAHMRWEAEKQNRKKVVISQLSSSPFHRMLSFYIVSSTPTEYKTSYRHLVRSSSSSSVLMHLVNFKLSNNLFQLIICFNCWAFFTFRCPTIVSRSWVSLWKATLIVMMIFRGKRWSRSFWELRNFTIKGVSRVHSTLPRDGF